MLGERLGFSISSSVFGYGLVIPHYGTIVVGNDNEIGKFAVLHTSTCITAKGKKIGDGLYLSTGSILTNEITLGDNVSVAANSLVNKSFGSNLLLVGSPVQVKASSEAWYVRDGERFSEKVKSVERLREKLQIL